MEGASDVASAVAMFVFGVIVLVSVVSGNWVNNYDGDARFECGGNQVMSFLGSVHSNRHEDRRWQFRCKSAPARVTDCHWTGFVNDYDQPLLFSCPGNEVLNGMHSIHDNKREDRRFQMKCCKVVRKSTKNCYFTGYINNFDDVMHFSVPENKYIKGFYSYHDNKREDRRWKVNLCSLV